MTKKQNGSSNGGGGAVGRAAKTATHSTHTTHTTSTGPLQLKQFHSLAPLAPRLIPLCIPNEDGSCSCEHHAPGLKTGHDSKSSGKAPVQRGWQHHNHKPKWPERYNVGIRLGQALAVVDVDPKNGGNETLARLEAAYGKLPATPEVISGSGVGRHLYVEVPLGQRGWKLPGVEFLCEGNQVVAPGSVHVSGKRYDWAAGRTLALPIAKAPDWLLTKPNLEKRPKLEVINTPDPRKEAWNEEETTLLWEGEEYSEEELSRRAALYVSAMPESVQGNHGSDVAFRVACAAVRGFLLPRRAALSLLHNWNEKKAKPKWSKGELLHKYESAEKARDFKWGYLIRGARDVYEEVTSPEPEEPEYDEEEDEDQPKSGKERFKDNRVVYIAGLDKYVFLPEGVDTGVQPREAGFTFVPAKGMRNLLIASGEPVKKAEGILRKAYHHTVDSVRPWPTNDRIISADGTTFFNDNFLLVPDAIPGPCEDLSALVDAIGGDDEGADWLWNWCAYVVQNPNVLPGVAVVLRGVEGVGKSKLGEMVGRCRGLHAEVGPSAFRAEFNAEWAGARLVVAAEVMLSEHKKEDSERFKAWITDPHIMYHRKSCTPVMIPNRVAWWLSSNNLTPVVISTTDRRFTVLDSKHPDPEIFGRLIQAWSDYPPVRLHEWDELRRFKHKLLNLKVDVKKARTPLANAARSDIQEASKSSVESFMDALWGEGMDALQEQYNTGMTYVDESGPNYVLVSSQDLYRLYVVFTKDSGRNPMGNNTFFQAAAKRGLQHTNPRRTNTGRVRYRLVPRGPKENP